MCAPRVTRHTSIRYSSSCHTRVSMGASITPSFSKMFIPRTNSLVCRRVLCVLWTKCTFHSNHRLNRVIFQQAKWLLPRSGHFLTTKTRIAPSAEMWTTMKNNLMEQQFLSCSFYLYRFRKYVFYGFPIINFCNPRVTMKRPVFRSVIGQLEGRIHTTGIMFQIRYFKLKIFVNVVA